MKLSGFLIIVMTVAIAVCFPGCMGHKDPVTGLFSKKENFDTLIDGKKVQLYTLRNPGGIAVQLTNYGGYLVSIIAPDKAGNYADVLLGYNKIKDYVTDKMMQGCIIGPNTNVMAKGRFKIDDIEYQLPVKDGGNNGHSGPDGFYKEVFEAEQSGNKVTLSLKVPDMKSGFPGNRIVNAIYELLPGDTLSLIMTMTSDRKTIVNMTNHAYFNLAGEGTGDVLDHIIRIFADSITPYSEDHVPTGEIVPVSDTPFDLRAPTPLGRMINSDNQQIKYGNGYDHNFVLSKRKGNEGIAVHLLDPQSGRFLEIYTNQPGLQLYTGNYLDGTISGRSGKPYKFRYGVAMEPQNFPDAPNHPDFPSPFLEPGEIYLHQIKYVFGVAR